MPARPEARLRKPLEVGENDVPGGGPSHRAADSPRNPRHRGRSLEERKPVEPSGSGGSSGSRGRMRPIAYGGTPVPSPHALQGPSIGSDERFVAGTGRRQGGTRRCDRGLAAAFVGRTIAWRHRNPLKPPVIAAEKTTVEKARARPAAARKPAVGVCKCHQSAVVIAGPAEFMQKTRPEPPTISAGRADRRCRTRKSARRRWPRDRARVDAQCRPRWTGDGGRIVRAGGPLAAGPGEGVVDG